MAHRQTGTRWPMWNICRCICSFYHSISIWVPYNLLLSWYSIDVEIKMITCRSHVVAPSSSFNKRKHIYPLKRHHKWVIFWCTLAVWLNITFWFGWSNDGTDTSRHTTAALQQTNTHAHMNSDDNDCCACHSLPRGVVHTSQQVEGTT